MHDPSRVPSLRPVHIVGVALGCLLACAREQPPVVEAVTAPVAPAAVAPVDGGRILAMLIESAPSVAVSMQMRGADVVFDLKGGGDPTTAIALLGSLTERLPGARAEKLSLDANAWHATVATDGTSRTAQVEAGATQRAQGEAGTTQRAQVAGTTRSAQFEAGTALTTVLAAARPVFTGGAALLTSGVVAISATRLSFTGALAPGRTIADAGDVVAAGYALTKVEAGPPFVLEIVPR